MAVVQHASYDDWRRAYGDVYDALPQHPEIACPNCAHKALQLEFVARADDRIGYGMFWCNFCRFGIRISRTWVPTGVDFHPMGIAQAELRKIVPEYTVVYPPESSEDPKDFEEVTL
jgi:hypothetical protein